MLNRVLVALILALLLALLVFLRDREQVVVRTVAQTPPLALEEEDLYSAYETLLDYDPDTAAPDIAVRRNIFRAERKTERKTLPVKPVEEKPAASLPVSEPMSPPFSLTGQIVENESERVTLILSDGTESFTAQLGETVKGHWRLQAVEGNALLCEDLNKGVVHKLRMGEPISSSKKSEPKESVSVPARPAAPITYKELLKRRAEIQNAKKK